LAFAEMLSFRRVKFVIAAVLHLENLVSRQTKWIQKEKIHATT